MNRIDRLVAILIHLQSKKLVTAGEIAERFEMSLRTVYRDIRALEQAGVPILSETGRGYSIMEGYHLPPVMFTNNEAAALLTANKMAEHFTDLSVSEQFNTAMFKIKSVLKESGQDFIERLDSHIVVFKPYGNPTEEFPYNFQTLIQQAILQKEVLKIEYFASYNKEVTERKVEPVGICFYSNRWHLIAFCRLRNEYRDFRLDRIKNILKTFETYTNIHPPLQECLFANNRQEDLISIVLRFKTDFVKEIAEIKYFYGFIDQIEKGEYIEMSFLINSFDWIGNWLLGLEDNVTILSPDSLKKYISDKVKILSEKYLQKNIS